MKKQKLKGFTLFELVIVIAIIGILATVAVPNMIYWISKSKYKTACDQAELIYNSVQTIVQKYDTIDRSVKDSSSKQLSGTHTCGNLTGVTFTDDANSELYKKIKGYYKEADRCAWAVKIENYKITAVYYSESESDNYVGIYPSTDSYDTYVKEDIITKYNNG
ncbi:MAG: Tfp pilus assembly protein FimT/FimU [Porcipelethomonas sp.]